MNRRTALRSLSLGLVATSGCTWTTSGFVDRGTTPTPVDPARTTIRVESVHPGGFADTAVVPEVTVVEPAVTDAHTAEIALSLTNAGETARTFQTARCPPADVHVATRKSGDERLVLLLADEWAVEPADPDCWRPRRVDFAVGQPCIPEETTLAAGATRTRTYEVWDHPENDACMPSGAYEFTETYRRDGDEHEWRFTLTVESA